VGGDLGVGLGREPVPLRLEPGTQDVVVLDDAVVHDGYVAGAIDVRVGVVVGRRAVGGPARVPDPERALEPIGVERRHERVELAGAPRHLHGTTGDDRDPGRVVAPVLELGHAVEQDGQGLVRAGAADVANDAAHV
jgi:hypothetical protein